MPGKKGKTPRVPKGKATAGKVQYLLSADRKLRTLSLRKMKERAAQARIRRRPRTTIAPDTDSHPVSNATMRPRAAIFMICGLVAATTLIAASSLSQRPEPEAGAVQAPAVTPPPEPSPTPRREPETPVPPPAPLAAVAPPPAAIPASARVEPPRAAASAPATRPTAADPRPAAVVIAEPPVVDTDAGPAADTAARRSAAAGAPPPDDGINTPAVTITGCLERTRDGFWLKDTEGADAPRSRSWKTGFLKKSAARTELVAGANTLRPADYVGQRVAATGVLTDRTLRARALRTVAVSCE